MLEALSLGSYSGQVVRFANPRDDVAALKALGIGPDSVPDMLDLLSRRAAPGGIQRLIDGTFEPWNAFGPSYGPGTRFSDGTWPVCYTALDQQTAEDEVKYHRGQALFGAGTGLRIIYYHLVELAYAGPTIDLRPQVTSWPQLTESDEKIAYPFCQSLGREACDRKLAGFLTQSARPPHGTNVPVFSRSALTAPGSRGLAAFIADLDSGEIQIEWL
jgi:RES domain